MGTYLNPGKAAFDEAVNSEIFVDKTEMIACVNTVVRTKQKYVSVSRPRRFGKTMAADMLCAYYDRKAGSRSLFEKCRISKAVGETSGLKWDEYLGRFDVLRLVMTEFLQDSESVDDMLGYLSEEVISELKETYPDVRYGNRVNLRTVMNKIYGSQKTQFVIIIDEWDAIFREYKDDKEGQKKYLDFLRDWLKDKEYIALAYMTGILPIKKYGRHSALNMFTEYSMIQPRQLAPYVGFTSQEVEDKCKEKRLDYSGFRSWYDGYRLSNSVSQEMIPEGENVDETVYREYEIYSPYSVVNAMLSKQFGNYWNQTETYEALQQYIDWNFEGLKEDVAVLMDGGRISVDITGYQNDMTTFHNKDDILTMLIHLGYLGFDSKTKEVFIPNKEVLDVFKSSTKNSRDWTVTFRALQNSQKLLKATWNCDKKTVAELLEAAHDKVGNKTYHSEAGLSYAVQLAYYAAQDLYTIIPELDTGKGYADLAFIPKKPDIPAMLIEFKYEKDVDTAIAQI
nr:ATP-binding protein [Butyrivibrio sp.]